MKTIVIRDIKNYFKNPLYWIGIILICFGLYQDLKPYLNVNYIHSENEVNQKTKVNPGDADVMYGYVPATREEQLNIGLNAIKKIFVKNFDMSKTEAAEAIQGIKNQHLSIDGTTEYLRKKYHFYNSKYEFLEAKQKKGTKTEINQYLHQKLAKHPYSYYFAKKFEDLASVNFFEFAMILLAFLFLKDFGKNNYELLHTKPVSSGKYIGGKVLGGVCSLLFALLLITLLFMGLCLKHCLNQGMPFNPIDFIIVDFQYIVPMFLVMVSIYTFISLIFKNSLPAIPILLVYLIYSNMGSYNSEGVLGFYGRIFGILFRFDGPIFETDKPDIFLFNQIFCLVASGVLLVLSARIWRRRRCY